MKCHNAKRIQVTIKLKYKFIIFFFRFEEDLCPPGEEELPTPSPAPDQEQHTPAITPSETPPISSTPDGSKLASPDQEQEEPGSTLKTCDLNKSSESDIQVIHFNTLHFHT